MALRDDDVRGREVRARVLIAANTRFSPAGTPVEVAPCSTQRSDFGECRFAWKAAVSAPEAIAVTRWSPTMRDRSATPIRMGIRRVSVIEAYGDHGVKPSFHRPPMLACGLALLIAACGMLVSTSGRPGGRAPRGRAGQGHQSGSLPQHHHQRRRQLRLHLQRGRPHRRPRDPLLQRQRRQARLRALAKRRHGARDEDGQGHQPWSGRERPLRDHGRQPHHLLHGRRRRPRGRAVAKRRHGAGDEDGQGHQPRQPSGHPAGFTDVNGILYFSAFDGTDAGLWRSDGTEAGTTVVKESVGAAPAHRRQRHPLLRRLRRFLFRAVAKRWHRGGDDLVKSHFVGSSSLHRLQRHPLLQRRRRQRPAAARCGEATAPRPARRWSRTSAPGAPSTSNQRQRAPSTSQRPSDPVPSRMSCGEATAPRPARPLSSRSRAALRPRRHQGEILYFTGGGGLWRSDGTPQGTTLVKGNRPGRLRPRVADCRQRQRSTSSAATRGTARSSGEATAPAPGRPSSGTSAVAAAAASPRISPRSVAPFSSPPRTAGTTGSCGGPGHHHARRGSARRDRTPRSWPTRGPADPLQIWDSRSLGQPGPSRRRSKMMSEDAKFALGY